MDNNKITRINREIVNGFREKMQKEIFNVEVQVHHSSLLWLSFFSEERIELVNSSFPNLEKEVQSFINCSYGSYEIDWLSFKNFVTNIEQGVKDQASIIYQDQLSSVENGYLAIIDSQAKEYSFKIFNLENINNEKDILIQSGIMELKNREFENNNLLQEINELKKKWEIFISSEQRSLTSGVLLLRDSSGWTIEQLREKVSELVKNERSGFAKIALLEHNLFHAENKIKLFKDKERQWFEFYSNWEKAKKGFLEALSKENEKYQEIVRKNFGLNEMNNSNMKKIDNLQSELSKLKKEFSNVQISLVMSANEFNKLNRANSISKIKLSLVLALDTSRNILPDNFSKCITYGETLLLASEVNSTSNRIAWGMLALFTIFSFSLGVLNIFKSFILLFRKIRNFLSDHEKV